nr:hypothetical protein CFP56_69643 [Quercus suber]
MNLKVLFHDHCFIRQAIGTVQRLSFAGHDRLDRAVTVYNAPYALPSKLFSCDIDRADVVLAHVNLMFIIVNNCSSWGSHSSTAV